MTRRLIETWLPIAKLGIESLRERTPMTPFPAPNRLHVWWARRPLVASRAAILASLLPADADHEKFTHLLGIHGDPVASRKRVDMAKRTGERFEGQAYSYSRAFTYMPTEEDIDWFGDERERITERDARVLDPTAGGGSVPFESARLRLSTLANDLNPVAALIQRATIEFPLKFGLDLHTEFERIAKQFLARREVELEDYFPSEPDPDAIPTNYIWARSITCPYCNGVVPLSPNWRLAPDGTGARLKPHKSGGPNTPGRRAQFDIVKSAKEQSGGTVSGGDATCCFDDCARLIDGDEIKRQAHAGQMGEQLCAVVYKRRTIIGQTKSGKKKEKWVRGYRAPRAEDDVSERVRERLAEKMPEWEATDMVPTERVPAETNDDRPIQYGMPLWRDLFSPRQLLGHGTAVEVYRQLLESELPSATNRELTEAAFCYLALSIDKMLNYNSRMSVWMPTREVMANTFNRRLYSA